MNELQTLKAHANSAKPALDSHHFGTTLIKTVISASIIVNNIISIICIIIANIINMNKNMLCIIVFLSTTPPLLMLNTLSQHIKQHKMCQRTMVPARKEDFVLMSKRCRCNFGSH